MLANKFSSNHSPYNSYVTSHKQNQTTGVNSGYAPHAPHPSSQQGAKTRSLSLHLRIALVLQQRAHAPPTPHPPVLSELSAFQVFRSLAAPHSALGVLAVLFECVGFRIVQAQKLEDCSFRVCCCCKLLDTHAQAMTWVRYRPPVYPSFVPVISVLGSGVFLAAFLPPPLSGCWPRALQCGDAFVSGARLRCTLLHAVLILGCGS